MTKTTLNVGDVAERYGVSPITIGRWWRAGVIPKPVRIGRRVLRWYATDLDAFDAQQRVEKPTTTPTPV